jgi:L-lactate dehydrogenase (cytochrome)
VKTDLIDRFPSVEDLCLAAKKRIPHFAWEHLASGTGAEVALSLNRAALNAVRIVPQFLNGRLVPSLGTRVFDQEFQAPFGIAPVGMTGLLWPGSEHILAKAAALHGIPYCLSAVACETPETVGPMARGRGWFQLYPPRDRTIRDDLIRRARESGFTALIVSVDVPGYGMRERQRRVGLTDPPRMRLNNLLQIAARPSWAAATLLHGAPRFRTLEKYAGNRHRVEAARFVLHELCAAVDREYLKEIRDQWQGPLVLKGILHPEDARRAVALGVDGIIVSNHGGRQFDGTPASIQVLPSIVAAVGGTTTIILDSGVRTGLDIVRAIVLGAEFVLLGRAFMYGVAALGERGGDHVSTLLKEDTTNNMTQLGVASVDALRHMQTAAAWRTDLCDASGSA